MTKAADDVMTKARERLHANPTAESVSLSRYEYWDLESEIRQLRRDLDRTQQLLEMANLDRLRDKRARDTKLTQGKMAIEAARNAVADFDNVPAFEHFAKMFMDECDA